MKAVDYLKAKGRMTNGCNANYCVFKCPLSTRRNKTYKSCTKFESSNPEEAIEIVEKWAKENPPKTYLSVLLEKLPHTKLYNGNDMPYPKFCPHSIFNIEEKCPPTNCVDCWNREYKEEI